MTWFRKSPVISLFLLLLTYGVEGWLYGSWMTFFLRNSNLYAHLAANTRLGILYGVAVSIILLCVVVLTAPISLVANSIDNWLKSDIRAFLSIFLGAFAFTIIVQQVDYFARFLVFAASALLLRLDLQLLGFNRWLCTLCLIIFCWLGFTGGILAFYVWS